MKRILFVANVGKEHILKFHLPSIRKFKDNGWEVDVMCAGDDPIPECDHHIKAKWKRSPFNMDLLKGIKQLKNHLKINHYDIIYCHTPVGGLVSRLAGRKYRKKGTKIVYFAHGFHFYKGAPLINWIVFYPLEKILSRWTDRIITINEEDYKKACNLIGTRNCIKLNGIGINLSLFSAVGKSEARNKICNEFTLNESCKILIYLAELSLNKNQGMLLKAMPYVLKSFPETYLVLAGIDHVNGKYQKYAEQLGISKHVLFMGWRKDKEVLYKASDVCVASSIREGFGINLVEALASNVPVVATSNRGHSTIIQNGINGFLVGINDYKSMADRILDCLNHKYLLADNDLSRFDEKIILNQLFNFIIN